MSGFEEHQRMIGSRKHHLPGYTGYVRGSQHISGRTFGETTRRAFETDYYEKVCTSPIPSGPQANRKIPQENREGSFVDTFVNSGGPYHVPGYTGHVPGTRATFGTSFGKASNAKISEFNSTHPRPHPQERPNFAYTSRPRNFRTIDSAPLPGTADHREPCKMIPAHLKYVKFFAM